MNYDSTLFICSPYKELATGEKAEGIRTAESSAAEDTAAASDKIKSSRGAGRSY
jgi:hypothetical protein